METDMQKRRSVRRILRLPTAGALLLLLCFYFLIPSVHSQINGLVMLYTQKSAQTIQGAIQRAGGFAPLKAIALSAFQSFALPWLLPYGIGGNVLAFGRVLGGALSALGAMIGASAWFGLVRLFLGDVLQKQRIPRGQLHVPIEFCLIAALNFLTLGILCVPAAAAGALRLSFRRFLLFALIAELPVVILFAVYCSAYRMLLPNEVERMLRFFGVLFLIAGAAAEANLRKKDASGN